MRFITFKTLEGKNFLSFGDTTTQICLRPGVNAIIGTNCDKEDSKNGAGKSSITEMLYYSLYGTTLREISKDHIQNSLTKKRCYTSLEFDVTNNNKIDNYKVVRFLNPTKCSLYKNGEDITRSTLAKTNALIQEIIRTPSTVFQNSVIMSANTALPFMALPKTDKRKFVESVLGLEIFTHMVLKARDDYSSTKRDYEINYQSLEQTQTELEFNETQFANYNSLKQTALQRLQEKQQTLLADIKTLKSKIVQSSQNDLKDITSAIEQLNVDEEEIKKKIDHVKNKLAHFVAEINIEVTQLNQLQNTKNECPTCKRGYSAEHVQHVLTLIDEKEQKINLQSEDEKKIKTALIALEAKGKKIRNQKQNLVEQMNKINTDINENRNLQTSIAHFENNLKEVQDEIEETKNKQNIELKIKLDQLKATTEKSKTLVDKLNEDLTVLETVKFVISEEGIKSFIVKKILTVLNSRIAYYLQKLEANCLCKFNEFFDEEIIDENSEQKSYFNFSGGERKRIDLACLFAFSDIRRLQGDVNFSTVFYDELLDSSLDDRGVSLTLRVLRERFIENSESCYIITHRGPEVTTKAEHTIHVIKRNGVSFISS